MRSAALLAAVFVIVLGAIPGGCPQPNDGQAETGSDADGNVPTNPAAAPADQTPVDRRPGVNPLAPMPVPIEVPPLRPPEVYWTNSQGRAGWFSDPADGVPIPGPDEVLGETPLAPIPTQVPETRASGFVDPGAALEFGARQIDALARVFSLFGELGSTSFWYEPLMSMNWGRCPRAAIISGETISIVAFKYGGGCATPSIGGEMAVGSCGNIIYPAPTPAATYVTDDVTIGGRSIRPHLVHPRISASLPVLMNATITNVDDGVVVQGPCDFETVGVGRAAGELLLHIGPDYVFDFEHAALDVTNAARSAQFSFAALRTQPARHGNFVPDAGTLQFTASLADGAHVLVLMYRAASPIDGVVQASVDGGEYFSYTLPADLLE
jgi:hypothetical protein